MRTLATGQSGTQLGRIKASIREQLQSGIFTEGQKLPSERELSELFSTTRITLKDALVSLETEGLIYREERRGWYVSPERVRYNPLSRSHFHQMIHEQHRIAETRLLSTRTEMATGDYAKALEIEQITPIHVIERLRFIDGRAVLFVENVLKAPLFDGVLSENLTMSLTGIYREKYGYETQRSRFDVIPTSAPAHVAKALNLAEGQPVLKICRVNYKQDGELMDCELEYWRPDSVVIHIDSIG
ncbi:MULTISPECIES: UTRA domain-containing protein [unclassified Vibrio]|uniref:UTRA domain-containing protein n=1 Tax=unclassified Vibrio TaxID=2614977 RepID=UPI000C83A40C|nr:MULTISPECIES: UTRA domain-containing protein [unclassified Vibrio]PMO07134.1 MFS transporter [Vibrio sp. 10N.222.55.C12]PMO15178.1 MFS transporter [Vibrio sp. 10N.222.54.F10]PMO23062.1 MFS transporter [Vibrio sp. 10N.222.54.B6]TKF42082.1 UTRA domain-containing protein [Vibrio sp. F13]TKF51424.1 UTRA domain-containing protein [Vibrio sp. F13]